MTLRKDLSKPIQVVTTAEKREDLQRIAVVLVEQGLAACAQIDGPVSSIYRWQEKLEITEEWRCTFKTDSRVFPTVVARIRELHPYDTPEILATAIDDGSTDYLEWMDEQLDEADF